MIRAALKAALAHRLRFALTTLAVTLGVTFVAGTFIYTDTLNTVFSSLVEGSTEGVDVYIQPEVEFESLTDYGVGGPGLPEPLVDEARGVSGVAVAEGSVNGYAQFVDKNGEAITPFGPPTLGISWTENRMLSSVVLKDGRGPAASDEVAMDAATAERFDFAVGDEVEVLLRGPKERFELVGIFDSAGGGFGGATLAAFELSTAQELFEKEGKVDAIEVAAEEGISPVELRNALSTSLSYQDLEFVTGEDQASEMKQQIQQGFGFFTTVLLVFAGIAVLVGAFIIFNTFSMIVAQRMREFGLLRAIGATGRQVMTSVLIEAAIVAVIASTLGIALGMGTALGLQKLMEAAGFDMPSATLELRPRTIVAGFAVGLGVTLFSALAPARRAAAIPPIAAMQELRADEEVTKRRRLYIGAGLTGAGVVLMAAGLMSLVDQEISAVGAGALLVFLGIATLGPIFARGLAGALASPLPRIFGITGTLARENSRRAPRRTASTAAALMIGLALVTLVATFASSLKGSIDSALSRSVKADLIVLPQSFANTAGFTPAIRERLQRLPEVEVASPMRFGEWMGDDDRTRTLLAVDPDTVDEVLELDMRSGSLGDLRDGGLLLRDVEAETRGLTAGDFITMIFESTGEQEIEVDGVFGAATDDRYLLSLASYAENYSRQSDIQVHVVGAEGIAAEDLRAAVEGSLSEFPNVRVLDQAGLREESSKLIDQMLNMVYGLLGLALIIAVLGITNTLALSVYERRREFGLLRAVGATKTQIRRMIRWEAAVIALFGTVVGVVIGSAFGWALITSLRDEGFTRVVLPVEQIAVYIVVAGAAGLLAAVVPARRAARLDVLEAIAFE